MIFLKKVWDDFLGAAMLEMTKTKIELSVVALESTRGQNTRIRSHTTVF